MFQLAAIIILGIIAQWLAWRLRVPAILPLIIIGLLVGPLSTYWTTDGNKWLEPMFNEATNSGLFPGKLLFYFVSLSIGIILFEGGLTLKRREIKQVGPAILKLITIGSIVTFFGAGLVAHFFIGLNWYMSFLFAGLIIVTGPTVIAPILQNLPLNRNVATVLKWEGILIDPIGALVAVLVFEFILSGQNGGQFTSIALITFFKILITGLLVGAAAAYGLFQLIKRDLIPHYLLNVFTLALVLGAFVLSDIFAHESGLLTVVIMGMVLGNLEVPRLNEILSFKESLSVLLISILFILLAANMDMSELKLLLNWQCLALFLVIVLVLRPLGVMLSTGSAGLSLNEKLFISWVGPRGIVAAGVASLFGIQLSEQGFEGAEYITPLVFMIVLGTVLLNATTARWVAKMLGVIQSSSSGILFVGANMAARVIARYLQDQGRHVVLIDSNESAITQAQTEGLEAVQANVFSDVLSDNIEFSDVGYLIAMTSSAEVNTYAAKRYQSTLGELGTFRLITSLEMKMDKTDLPQQGIFSYTDDFLNLNEVARDFPNVYEMPVSDNAQLKAMVQGLQEHPNAIPIFIKTPDNVIDVIPNDPGAYPIDREGYALVYIGQKMM